jgi:hypothetical protein
MLRREPVRCTHWSQYVDVPRRRAVALPLMADSGLGAACLWLIWQRLSALPPM